MFDGTAYSTWSRKCEFTGDIGRPNPPGLTVTPEGPYTVGQEITLRFTDGGSSDVVRYGFGFFGSQTTSLPAGVDTARVVLTFAGRSRVRRGNGPSVLHAGLPPSNG